MLIKCKLILFFILLILALFSACKNDQDLNNLNQNEPNKSNEINSQENNIEDISYTKDGSVFIVTEDNIESLKKTTKFLIIEFYYEDCIYCINFAPIYKETAFELSVHSNIKFGKVDVTLHPRLSTKYKVAQFPTIILLTQNDSNIRDYNGDLNHNDFKTWVLKKSIQSTVSLDSATSLQSFIKNQHKRGRTAIVFFKDDDRIIQETVFTQVSKEDENFDYGICTYKTCAEEHMSSPGTVNIYLTNGEVKKYLEAFDYKVLGDWLIQNTLPLVIPFGHEASELLFAKYKPSVFLYREEKDALKYDKILLDVSKKIKENYNVY